MAHVFSRYPGTGGPAWAVSRLDDDRTVYVLTGDPRRPVRIPGTDGAPGHILLQSSPESGMDAWALLCPPGLRVRVNGDPVRTGIRVLQDRDEVLLDGTERLFFSTERAARPEPFPGSERRVVCPRCKQPIAKGDMAVRCPNCGVWSHQSETYPCWSYTDACAVCGHPTAMDDRYRWTPDAL